MKLKVPHILLQKDILADTLGAISAIGLFSFVFRRDLKKINKNK